MKRLLVNTWQDELRQEEDLKAQVCMFRVILVLAVMAILILVLTGNAKAEGELKASWYSVASLHKEGTWAKSKGVMANGKAFSDTDLTCANRLYPLGTMLIITNKANGKSVIVKTTDRIGKRFANTRVDLSKGAFSKIASLKEGLIEVSVKKVVINVKST